MIVHVTVKLHLASAHVITNCYWYKCSQMCVITYTNEYAYSALIVQGGYVNTRIIKNKKLNSS